MADSTRHDEFVAGLRDLLAFYEATPDFPVPWSLDVHLLCDDAEQMAARARQLGGKRTKTASEKYFDIRRDFGGGVTVELYAEREKVCFRRVVGVEKAMVPDPSAPMVEVEREVVEWDCQPVLADATNPPMHCTEYVPGDPDGCARCGERADLHDGGGR